MESPVIVALPFARDTQRNKWVLVAVLNSYAGNAGKPTGLPLFQ